MTAPVLISDILAQQAQATQWDCPVCSGHGERLVFDWETGKNYCLCDACRGSGYNPLGLLVHAVLHQVTATQNPFQLATQPRPNRAFQPKDAI